MTAHWIWRDLCKEYRGTMLWLQICSLVILVLLLVEAYR